jgi:hypothetical protein
MKEKASRRDWLPLAKAGKGGQAPPTGEAFSTEWIDFSRGIRVGNLEPHERITRIIKYRLERDYATDFITDRWGRGTFWQWICWLPRADRDAKTASRGFNFGCAKLFISVDRSGRIFQSGLQVERGYASGKADWPGAMLAPDWDWHRLMKLCAKGTELDGELRRLILREGFMANVGGPDGGVDFTRKNFSSAGQVRAAARGSPPDAWTGFQLYYPMSEREVRSSGGYELVQAVLGVFGEVTGVMNMCMQIELRREGASPRLQFKDR